MESFKREYQVIWADLDPNAHMRHTAYNDYAAQVRVNLFDALGAPLPKLIAMGFGPILFQENTSFYREVRMNEVITVSCAVVAMRRSGKIWKFRHEIARQSGELACKIEVEGAFMDLRARKVAPPPAEVLKLLDRIPKAEDFEWMD